MFTIQPNTLHKLKILLNAALCKLSENTTLRNGIEKIRLIIKSNITNDDRMNTFITSISEFHECTNLLQRKESLKLFGMAGEIFEDTMIPFIPKILTLCTKRLDNTQLHLAISDSIGVMCHFIMKSKENVDHQMEFLAVSYTHLTLPTKRIV